MYIQCLPYWAIDFNVTKNIYESIWLTYFSHFLKREWSYPYLYSKIYSPRNLQGRDYLIAAFKTDFLLKSFAENGIHNIFEVQELKRCHQVEWRGCNFYKIFERFSTLFDGFKTIFAESLHAISLTLIVVLFKVPHDVNFFFVRSIKYFFSDSS